jgi:hypothetical protein
MIISKFPINRKDICLESQADNHMRPPMFMIVYHEKQKRGTVVQPAGGFR